jgi:PII-like signaling protein
MRSIERVEIVIDALHGPAVLEVLERHGLTGWTLLRVAAGAGERGERRDDELSGASTNSLLITTCEPEALEALAEDLRPLLRRYGGVCLVSPARWLIH